MARKRKATGVVLAEGVTEQVGDYLIAMIQGRLAHAYKIQPYLSQVGSGNYYAVHCDYDGMDENDPVWMWASGFCAGILRERETRELENDPNR